jgi:hypothetical protein
MKENGAVQRNEGEDEEAVATTDKTIAASRDDSVRGAQGAQLEDIPPSAYCEDRGELLTPAPPDGGFNAWLQVALAHLINQNTVCSSHSISAYGDYVVLGRLPLCE